jgi:hypothetical protein
MAKMRGKPIWIEGRIWVPAYHPAYIARNRKAFPEFVEDLQLALALRFAEDKPLPIPPWDEVTIEGKHLASLGPSLEKRGYAWTHSKTLGCQIVILRQEGIKVPDKLAHLPSYTFDELVRVGMIGKGREWTESALRRLHIVKSEFNGMVVQG